MTVAEGGTRQAVVLIHGIGEQRPMETLRRFVDAVLPEPAARGRAKFFSKPDPMSRSFELRRLDAPQTRTRPRTDFYEYYWAHEMEGTRYGQIVAWLQGLLLRKPGDVPSRLYPLWLVSWLAIAALGVVVIYQYVAGDTLFSPISLTKGAVGAVVALLLPLANGFALRFIGDAARYLSPRPENIATRQRIRANGIELLRRLQRSGKYGRIVVVGHSLGSVIGYDLITYLWQEVHDRHASPLEVHQDALKAVEHAGEPLSTASSEKQVSQYRALERGLWLEQRRLGNPWLITDFVTLGSPLSSAALLLESSGEGLRQRQRERELPTCPPEAEEKRYSFPLPPYEVAGHKRTIRVLHHAAQFACTRWTNLYFPGDFVGGPLRPVFGPGIEDVPVRTKWAGGLLGRTPFSHTHYWDRRNAGGPGDGLALDEVRRGLDLESADGVAPPVARGESGPDPEGREGSELGGQRS